jgi:serine/threonine protein kinase
LGVGSLLGGRYRLGLRMGGTGNASVFSATDEHLNRPVAVKFFDTERDPDAASRRDAELNALAALNHPNLIRLFDAHADRQPYLVMELIDGPTLAARLTDGPVQPLELREIGIQIADALAYVHAAGLIHRDIKPENILLGVDGRARLSDFGIAQIAGVHEQPGGTAAYLSPEQTKGVEVGPESDIYSLGLVFLEALTGHRSYDGPPGEAALARLTETPEVPSTLPRPWLGLLRAMTANDPRDRPTAAEVQAAITDGFFEPRLPVALRARLPRGRTGRHAAS